jgi:uncharacterized protein YndB with AHSA1/START domain
MDSINIAINVPGDRAFAFRTFVGDFNAWWPKAYTWSGDSLVHIGLATNIGGLCSEIGPEGFRCDWGRILRYEEGKLISFRWQISFERIPVPDASKCSEVHVTFDAVNNAETSVSLEHKYFERHGEKGERYRDALASEQGWPLILEQYKKYCSYIRRR